MAYRRIVDNQDNVWDVWEVNPASSSRALSVPLEMQAGWLAFQCGEERRRIAPLPVDWSEMSDAALMRLMSDAAPIRPRVVRTR
jgi:hypothetical protein